MTLRRLCAHGRAHGCGRLLVALLVAVATVPLPARAADAPKSDISDAAREHFARGVELYDEGDYKLALIEFERAYAVSSSFRILYNIGQVHAQLGQYAKALGTLERYLSEGADRITAERKAEVQRDIGTLQSRTAMLELTGTAGADITMDDEPLGKLPIASHRVNAGEHRIVATKAGFIQKEQRLTLAGGDQAKLEITLVPQPVAPPPKRSEIRPAAWITWAGAGALGAGAVVTGLFAMSSASDLKTLRDTPSSSADARDSAASRARGFAIASDVLLGTAVVAGGVAMYLTLKKPSETSSATTGVSDVRVNVGLGSIGASGAF